MKVINAILKINLAILVAFAPGVNFAAIIPHSAFNEYETINQTTKELNLSVLEKAYLISVQHQFRMEDYVPYREMPRWDNGKRISGRILRHTIQNIIEDEDFKSSAAVTSLSHVNNSMSTNVGTGRHKVQMRLKAFEAKAVVSYEGIVKASMIYDVAQNEMEFEVSKKVGEKTFALTHSDDGGERRELLGVRWTF